MKYCMLNQGIFTLFIYTTLKNNVKLQGDRKIDISKMARQIDLMEELFLNDINTIEKMRTQKDIL